MAGAANLENDETTSNGQSEVNQHQEREQEPGGVESARSEGEDGRAVNEAPSKTGDAQSNSVSAPKRQKHPSAGNMVIYSSSEGFPKPSVEADDNSDFLLDLPFTQVAGEGARFLGRTKDGTLIALTNYRIFVAPAPSSSPLINVPLGLLEAVELRDLFFIHLACKDSRCYRVALSDNAVAEIWYSRLRQAIAPPTKMEDVFALAHFAWAQEENMEEQGCTIVSDGAVPSIDSEIKRMEFDLDGSWRLTDANRNYKLCSTYPEKLIVPAGVTDDHLKVVAGYRAGRRIPAVVWRHTRSGAVLARCSQPEVGWWGWRSDKDEKYVEALAQSCHYDRTRVRCASGSVDDASSVVEVEAANGNGNIDNDKNNHNGMDVEVTSEEVPRNQRQKKVLVMDARSYAAAFANRVRGGGMECAEYYDCCEVEFMNLANIHEVRKSFLRLRGLINSTSDQSTWFSNLESTKWLYYLSCLLSSAVRCARALDEEERPVVVHCSDGWDRTSQISSLAQLLLDPYYRTIEGFEVLVEREWLSFGHKMADRNGNPLATSDANERCPIFLQWLDCVHQLLFQFPCAFQFNNSYLIKLARHTYSNLFGTFLCNNDRERKEHNVKTRTRSVWMYLRYDMGRYVNYLYKDDRESGSLRPKTDVRCLLLWQDMYTDFVATQSCPFTNGGSSSDGGNSVINGSSGGTESGGSLEDSPSPSPKQTMSGSGAVETAVTLADGLAERVLSVANGMRSMLRDDLEGGNLSPSVIVSENVSESEVHTETVVAKESNVIGKPSNDEVEAGKLTPSQRIDGPNEKSTKIQVEESRSDFDRPVESSHVSDGAKLSVGDKGPLLTSTDTLVGELEQQPRPTPQNTLSLRQQACPTDNGVTNETNCPCASNDVAVFFSSDKRTPDAGGSRMDSDGLVAHVDPAQERVREIVERYRGEVQRLKREVHVAKQQQALAAAAASSSPNGNCNGLLTTAALYQSNNRGGIDDDAGGCHFGAGSTTSEASSFEQVETAEARPTLWLPDHATSSCMKCNSSFWMARRKHHCRSCGGIFCSTCAGQFRPVPSEQLYDPVRVCDACNTKAAMDRMSDGHDEVAVEQAEEAVLAVAIKGNEPESH